MASNDQAVALRASGEMKQLRFAVLARVSTKRQEEEGESLDKQQCDLRKAVERYGGAVVRDYSGQESATSGKVRPVRGTAAGCAARPIRRRDRARGLPLGAQQQGQPRGDRHPSRARRAVLRP